MADDWEIVGLDRETIRRLDLDLDCPHVALGLYRKTKTGKLRKCPDGTGGLLWRAGLCWLWLDGVDMKHTHPVVAIRMARLMLRKAKALGETRVIAVRDEAPCSRKLLEMLGATYLGDFPEIVGREVWQWDLRAI